MRVSIYILWARRFCCTYVRLARHTRTVYYKDDDPLARPARASASGARCSKTHIESRRARASQFRFVPHTHKHKRRRVFSCGADRILMKMMRRRERWITITTTTQTAILLCCSRQIFAELTCVVCVCKVNALRMSR